MLAIRMQRIGRKGHPIYRMIVQESRYRPTSGKIVAKIGNYDPHTKVTNLNAELAQKYLDNGAQPSDRVVSIFTKEGIKLPKWVKTKTTGTRSTRNPDKLRRNQPAEEVVETEAAEVVETEATNS